CRPSRWRSTAELPPGVAARSRATLLHRVVGRNSKQVCGRLFALNIRHSVCGSSEARIGSCALDHDLQVGGIPALETDLYRFVVSNLPNRNSARGTCPFCAYTVDRLCAQRLLLQRTGSFFALQTLLHLLLESLCFF